MFHYANINSEEQLGFLSNFHLIFTEFNGLTSVTFEDWKEIEILEIEKKEIKAEWSHITNGLVSIPSVKFRKLLISTESLDFTHITQLANAVLLLKRQMYVEVRCERLTLKINI